MPVKGKYNKQTLVQHLKRIMSSTIIRFGQISFLNTLPLSFGETDTMVEPIDGLQLKLTNAPPKQLNEMILDGQLDVSAVSSAFYLKHQAQLTLLKQPCVGSMGPVESVCLFIPANAHTNDFTWHTPNTSETSIAMGAWILNQQGLVPSGQQIYPMGQGKTLIEQNQIVLAIGDEALLLNHHYQHAADVHIIDVASAWVEQTGQPAVFGVWVAQTHWAKQHAKALQQIEAALAQQAQTFFADPQKQQLVFTIAQQRYPLLWKTLGQQGIKKYLTQSLFYNFSSSALDSLKTLEHHCLLPAKTNLLVSPT